MLIQYPNEKISNKELKKLKKTPFASEQAGNEVAACCSPARVLVGKRLRPKEANGLPTKTGTGQNN